MEYLNLPHTDLRVSRLIAGCMGLGGGWGRSTVINAPIEKQARDFVDTALELGINFFDHANIYARGRAEESSRRSMPSCGASIPRTSTSCSFTAPIP